MSGETSGGARTRRGTRPAALAGCRVLELSHAAAAVAGRVLADLGADVIKVEPAGGEAARRAEPALTLPNGEHVSRFWLAFNVNKRSVCIDLDTDDGARDFAGLARSADIVVTDFERFGTAECDRLYGIARAANPALVWVEIWPFGRGAPHESYPATDTIVQALGGHLFLNGDIDRPPVRIGLPVASLQAGSEAAAAGLMAYYHRLKSGEGQRVDVSMQECVTWTLLNTTMAAQLLGLNELRGGAVRRERANRFYTRQVWQCADGYIVFGPVGGGGGAAREKSYSALVAWMNEDGIYDPILTAQDWNGPNQFEIAQENYDKVTKVIEDFIATKSTAELMARAVENRILLAPISGVRQILDNPHARSRGFYQTLNDAGRGTSLDYPAVWAHLSATPLRDLGPAPQPGQDTQAVLQSACQPASEVVCS
jgi:crotonobetainyl-CoA:carnitine CoA-transferase CaiB-like acyl-CoA transferase